MVKRDQYAAAKAAGADTLRMVAADAVAVADVFLGPCRDPRVRGALGDVAFICNHFSAHFIDFRASGFASLKPEVKAAGLLQLGVLLTLLAEISDNGRKLRELLDATESVRAALVERAQ